MHCEKQTIILDHEDKKILDNFRKNFRYIDLKTNEITNQQLLKV